jgi:hypothetical protein
MTPMSEFSETLPSLSRLHINLHSNSGLVSSSAAVLKISQSKCLSTQCQTSLAPSNNVSDDFSLIVHYQKYNFHYKRTLFGSGTERVAQVASGTPAISW